jgi:hypothetical protein
MNVSISVNDFCLDMNTSRMNVHRVIRNSGYLVTRPGRPVPGGVERYSAKDCFCISEMVVLREFLYPWELLRRINEVFYADLTEQDAIDIWLNDVPYEYQEEVAAGQDKGHAVLYPPHVLAAVERRCKPLGRHIRKLLGREPVTAGD